MVDILDKNRLEEDERNHSETEWFLSSLFVLQ